MNADLAAVFFSLILGISACRIQASSSSTTTGSSPSSSSTTASPKASSSENTPSVFPMPSSALKAQVSAGRGSVNSTDPSTTTSLSSSSIVAETSAILASISRNGTVSSITAASLTLSSGFLSTSQSKSANSTEGNTSEVVISSVGSLSASASTILTSFSIILTPLQTTSSSSLSSSKRTDSSSGLESPSLGTTQDNTSSSSTGTFATEKTSSSSSGTFPNTRISATLSERLSSYPASTPATHTTSPRPTIPPEGTKMVNMEVTLKMEFRQDYNDVNSPVYKELVANLSKALFRVYQEVDGFVDVRVLFIRRGSIVCNYIVILASNSKVTDDDLKKKLEKGRKDGNFPFDVKGIAVIEDSDAVAAKKKLPQWAMTTMIVLGALAFCFLVIAICACIKYRNAMSSENYIYDVPPGKLDMRAYDAISMGHMRANVDGNTSTAQRRLVSSHENPTYGS